MIDVATQLCGAGRISSADLPSLQTHVDQCARRVVDGGREREQVLPVAFAGAGDRGQAGAEGEFQYRRIFLRLCEGRQMSMSAWLAVSTLDDPLESREFADNFLPQVRKAIAKRRADPKRGRHFDA